MSETAREKPAEVKKEKRFPDALKFAAFVFAVITAASSSSRADIKSCMGNLCPIPVAGSRNAYQVSKPDPEKDSRSSVDTKALRPETSREMLARIGLEYDPKKPDDEWDKVPEDVRLAPKFGERLNFYEEEVINIFAFL